MNIKKDYLKFTETLKKVLLLFTFCYIFLSVPYSNAGVLFKPHYSNAGLYTSWYHDTTSTKCTGRINKAQSAMLHRAIKGRSRGMVQVWAGMYEDFIRREERVGDAHVEFSMIFKLDGKTECVEIINSSTNDKKFLNELKLRFDKLRLRNLNLEKCIRVIVLLDFRLNLKTLKDNGGNN